jgi:hypothetical protein
MNLKDNGDKILRKVSNHSSNDTVKVVVVVVVVVVCPPPLGWCHHMHSVTGKSAQTILSIFRILT